MLVRIPNTIQSSIEALFLFLQCCYFPANMRMTIIFFKLFFLVLLTVVKTRADSEACKQKEKHLALIQIAKETISKLKDLPYGNDSKELSTNSSECSAKAKISAYLDLARNLIEDAEENYTICGKVPEVPKKSADCSEILKNGEKKSGRYTIWPRPQPFNGKPLEVYCDMDSDGGGWTVLQRRGDFVKKVDFNRNWIEYKNGFGNISEEFWIGNDKIFALTNQASYTLRFDLENVRKEKRFADYSSFWVQDESAGYMVHYGNYNGTAGDSFLYNRNMQFSTQDKIYEKSYTGCPTDKKSGFWFYSSCGNTNPNGLNVPGTNIASSMFWYSWGYYVSLQAIEMKIRPEKR